MCVQIIVMVPSVGVYLQEKGAALDGMGKDGTYAAEILGIEIRLRREGFRNEERFVFDRDS